MNSKSARLVIATLATTTALLAQGPPPPGGPGGHGPGGGPGFGPMIGGFGPGRTPVTGAPYSGTVTMSSVQTLATGNQITRNQQEKVYRDSQGRVRTEITMTPPNGGTAQTMITIFDPVAGFTATLNPQTSTAVKRTMPTAGTGPARTPPTPPTGATAPTVQTTDLGTKVINGLNATGTRTTVTIPAGAVGNSQALTSTREVWQSTDLKVPVLVTSSDPQRGTSTTQLTNVVRSEPDASLFLIPSSYTISTAAFPGRRPAGAAMPPPPSQE